MHDENLKTILVVDDEKPIRKAFRYYLDDLGFLTLEAAGGIDALDVFERESPDLILLDLRMPDLDGLEVLARVRKQDQDIPIIVVSGVGAVADAVVALRMGAWDYLVKPVDDLSVLHNAIEKCLERYRLIKDSRIYQDKIIESEEMHRTIIENADYSIIYFDAENRIVLANSSAVRTFRLNKDAIVGVSLFDFLSEDQATLFQQRFNNILKEKIGASFEDMIEFPEGRQWFMTNIQLVKDSHGIMGIQCLFTDITERKRAEEELMRHSNHLEELVSERTSALQKSNEELARNRGHMDELVEARTSELEHIHKELVEKAHMAGMADVATDTFHNVGDILSSVKTSTDVMNDLIKASAIEGLKKANEMLSMNIDCLEEFILNNPNGKKLMQYYMKLGDVFVKEHENIREHLSRIVDKISDIENVITAQQIYAGEKYITEKYALSDLVDYSLAMQKGSEELKGITIEKDFQDVPKVEVQKIKLVHVLFNLLKNADEAMCETPFEDRRLTFSIDSNDNAVFLKVRDYGSGIDKKNIKRIFSHGFTTKRHSHGFGLHNSANYMREMGGGIWAESEGKGMGTTFIIQFPIPSDV